MKNGLKRSAGIGLMALALTAGIGTAAVHAEQKSATKNTEQTQSADASQFEKGGHGPMGGMGKGMKMKGEGREEMKAVHEAVENNDFEAWKTAMSKAPEDKVNKDALTQENFDKLVKAHGLHEEARTLMDDVMKQIHPQS